MYKSVRKKTQRHNTIMNCNNRFYIEYIKDIYIYIYIYTSHTYCDHPSSQLNSSIHLNHLTSYSSQYIAQIPHIENDQIY